MSNDDSAYHHLNRQHNIPSLEKCLPASRSRAMTNKGRVDTNEVFDIKRSQVEVDKEQLTDAQDGGWGWFVMIRCLITHIVVGGIAKCCGVFYLHFKSNYGQSAEVTSWIVSLNFTLRILLGPFASALCNRFTVRTVVALGAALCIIGMVLSAISTDISFLSLGFGILLGSGFGLAYGPSLIILGQYFDKRRSLAAGRATSASPFSFCVCSALLELSFHHFGFFGTFLILSAVTSNLFISASLFRPIEQNLRSVRFERSQQRTQEHTRVLHSRKKSDALEQSGDIRDQNIQTDKANVNSNYESVHSSSCTKNCLQEKGCVSEIVGKQQHKKPDFLDFSLLKNIAFLCLCFQMFMFSLSFDTVFTYLPSLALEKGIDQIHGAYLLTFMGLCDGVLRIIVSIFLDNKRIRPYRPIIFNANMIATAAVTLVFPYMSTYSGFCVASGLYGFAVAIYSPQMAVVCVDILGVKHLTSSLGLVLAFEGVGSLVAPAVGGMIKDCLGSYDVAFYVGSVGTFIGGVVMAAGNVWFYKRNNTSYDTIK